MKIRRKTRKRGGGPREKLIAWINYVYEDALNYGWKKFPIIEKHTRKNGTIVKNVVEMEASVRKFGVLGEGTPIFPSTNMPMNQKYAIGLAMHLWNPQKSTGTNYDLYRKFESQYHNDSDINSIYGNIQPVSHSNSPVRGSNITGLRQHLTEVEEKIDSISSRSSSQPSQSPIPKSVSTSSVQTNNVRDKPTSVTTLSVQTNNVPRPIVNVNSARTKKNNQARIEELVAKRYSNAEEARELKELQKKLNEAAIPKWQSDQWSSDNLNNKLLKQITKNGDVILYVTCLSYEYLKEGPYQGPKYGPSRNISLIITNRNVYSVRIHKESYTTDSQGENGNLLSGLHYMPVYTFDQPLNLKQTKMLSILSSITEYREVQKDELTTPHTSSSILKDLSITSTHNLLSNTKFPYLDAKKKFESVIRLIPGSYKNGNWRPLDGFFGLYVNDTTMEVNEFPGEIL